MLHPWAVVFWQIHAWNWPSHYLSTIGATVLLTWINKIINYKIYTILVASLHRQQVDSSFSCFVAHLGSGSLEPVWWENYSWLNANSRSYFQCQRCKCLGSSESLLPLNFGKLDFLKCRFLHFAIISELFYETLYVRKVLCNVLPSDCTKKQKNLFRISW